jgi:hypothetical protein
MKVYREKNRVKIRKQQLVYRTDNQEKWKEKNKKWELETRKKCIEKYGGKCFNCGFSNPQALQFDHVNSDGYLDRNFQIRHKRAYLKDILNDETGKFQLLCANCNWIKYYEKKEYNNRYKK